jgi:FixJ family two-component response regulator
MHATATATALLYPAVATGNSAPARSLRCVAREAAQADLAAVHVIDFEEQPREGLGRLFRSVGLLAHTYASAVEFVDRPRRATAECVVLDVRLPGMSGLELQSHLPRLGIDLPLILTSAHADVQMVVQAMKAGAVDFFQKPLRDQDMLDAVHRALARDRSRRAIDQKLADLRNRFDSLTAREREVMLLVSAGKMNKQVAGELGLSEITVKIHRGSAMRKMEARTFADLVRMADTLPRAAAVLDARDQLQSGSLSLADVRAMIPSPVSASA